MRTQHNCWTIVQSGSRQHCSSSHETVTSTSRRGAALIFAIVALVICTSLSIALFQSTVLRQQRYVLRYQTLQAELLADSALERLTWQAPQLDATGQETWQVTLNEEPATARIKLTQAGPIMHVEILAEYPAAAELPSAKRGATRTLNTSVAPESISREQSSRVTEEAP